uniref:tRNA (32-2'-O)-methyltransferase regulator THADA n=1 Tax=Paramormyrops kingsleyae TaxID=1676925 RepID=A0A3B3QHT4_9TELE|nr:thyroid adenoma-associated protein isoform X1 [Paramormyrops kingsleyae]
MVVRKKVSKVEAVSLDCTKLEILKESLSVDGEGEAYLLAQTLRDSLCQTDPVQQIQLVKKAGTLLEQLREDSPPPDSLLHACLETLSVMYTSLQNKNPLKRAVASALSSVPVWLQEGSVGSLSVCLSDSLSTLGPDQYPHLTDCIASFLDGFPIGERCIHRLLTEVLQFLQKALAEYLQTNSGLTGQHVAQAQLMQSTLAAVKASMLVVQRSQEFIGIAVQEAQAQRPLLDALCELLHCHSRILTDEEFVQAVQSTAGMAVVLLTRSMLGNAEQVAEVLADMLLLPEEGDAAPMWLKESCAGLYQTGRPAAVSLYLCHGALAMLTWQGGLLGPQMERLLLLLPPTLLALDTSVKESSTAMVVARVLALWSGAALDSLQGEPRSPVLQEALQGEAELPGRLREHVYSHWEHPLDGVRHQTRNLFRNLLRMHQLCTGAANLTSDPFVVRLTQSLLGLEWHSRGKYGSLGCLVEHLGAEHLLALEPTLPALLLSLMGDQTLAPYASDLLEKLFVSHRAELSLREEAGPAWMDCWHRTWVEPLLEILCQARLDQTTYILDYFLPRLLRCSPASLGHMVQALLDTPVCVKGSYGSRGALGALMTCLRAARAQGVLRPAEERLWEGMVPLPLLRQAVVHKHDQVRMDALGLLCESHRSTEILSAPEMDLIRHFLPHNLNSQSPGVRQQTVSLFKKLLCRMKDSAQLVQKRTAQSQGDGDTLGAYQAFLHWLCETLFQALHVGASFSSALMALQLLGLVAEFFTFSSESGGFALGRSVSHAHAQAVLRCLASNFLEVKQLASALLQKLPASAVGLTEPHRMRMLLRVALDLSTSTKPFDSVTAAHLINHMVHLEGMQEALVHCAQEQGLSTPPPSADGPQASAASILERNTLAVVWVLLRCLQAEVIQAESSLLQAAASHPLYGRVHCITASLQQLGTGSLVLIGQWRSLVVELIATSYRMSDVVSPVVQSSSPEGLIPMDPESETAADLQRILEEIQPRDSNHFFAGARELDSQSGTGTIAPATPVPEVDGTGGDGEAYRVTAQMVLVCCWRSMKEVSMLLGQVCQTMPLQGSGPGVDSVITEEQAEGVGRYFRGQLLQSRHRGAFELAYVGFVRLTDVLCRRGSQILQQLPARWLREVLEEVKRSDPSSKLCATRRSAGIPFYIQALLSSEPKSSSCSLLKTTMRELTALAMPPRAATPHGSTVPQVHALNILRALYRDTRLGENVMPFVADGVQAAVLGFTSPVWAVRNSSTLLFSTLITRIFGVKRGKDEHSKKNRMTGREFFTRFPALYPFLLGQLEEAAMSVESDSGKVKLHPSLYLLLLVLGRLYPSPMDGSCSPLGLATFLPFIIKCGRSAVYRTRQMAARALVPFVSVTQLPSTIGALLEDLPVGPGPQVQQNHIHGTLLQVLHLLSSYHAEAHRSHSEAGWGGDSVVIALQPRLWLATRTNPCLVTRASMLDLLGSLCAWERTPADAPVLSQLCEEALSILMESELVSADAPRPPSSPGAAQYLLSLARLAVSAALERPELWGVGERGPQLLGRLLQCPHHEVRLLVLEEVLKELEGLAEGSSQRRPVSTFLEQSACSLTTMALQEKHPQCLEKVLQVLSKVTLASILPWRDGTSALTHAEALDRLLALAEGSVHSVNLHCAALALTSQLLLYLAEGGFQQAGSDVVPIVSRWGALMSRCCGEEQPMEVKLAAADILVNSTPGVLASAGLPLGLSNTVALWRSLFTLLQDEDREVRDRASDFATAIPRHLLDPQEGVPDAVCPPVALELGLRLLCRLFEEWGQVPAGVLILTDWLLGEGEPEVSPVKTPGLDEEFLFEKGELNLWAEPLKWAWLLHRHLCPLLRVADMAGVEPGPLEELFARAGACAEASGQMLQALPALPQFSCTAEHERLTVTNQRACSALEVLGLLQPEQNTS